MTLVPRDKPLVLQIDTNDNLPHGLAEANAITVSSVIATTLSAYDYSGLALSGLGDIRNPISPTAGQALIWDEGIHKWRPGTVGGGGGGGTPAGGPNEIQFNDGAGSFAADPGFTFTPAVGLNPGTLEVPKIIVSESNPPGVVVFGSDGSLSSVPINDGEILVGVAGDIPGVVAAQSPLSVGGGALTLGTVPVSKGGTGVSTFPAAGTILTGGTTLGSFTPASNSLVIKDNAGTLTSLAPGNSKLVATDGTGQLTSISLPLPLGSGGTGQTTAGNALNALLPSQGGNSGKYLKTDGSVASWDTPATGGGGATAYGSVGQVQFNDGANGFYAKNTFTFASATNTLSVVNLSAEGLDLGTALPLTEGGTGATNAATARLNLGLGELATASIPLLVVSGGTGNTASMPANYIPYSDGSKLVTKSTLTFDPTYDSFTAGIIGGTAIAGTTVYGANYRVGNILTSNPFDLSTLNSVSQNLVANPTNGQVLTWSATKWITSAIPQSPDFTSALSSLNDVSNTIKPITGASLVWSGGAVNKWTAAVITPGGGGTVASLDDIGDVTITSPTNTQVLRWDGSKWINDFIIPSYTVSPGLGGSPEASRLVISDGSGNLSSISGVGFTQDFSSIFVSGHIVTPTLLTNIIQTTDGNANTIFFAPGTHALEISPDPLSNNGKLGITGNTIVEGNLEVVGNYGVGYVSANDFIKSDKFVYAPNVSATLVSATTYKNLPPSIASAVGTYTEFQFRNPAGGLSSNNGIYYDPTNHRMYAYNLEAPYIIATDIVGNLTNNYWAFDDGSQHASTFILDPTAADGKLAIINGNGLIVSGNIQSNKYVTAPQLSGTTLSGTNLSALNLSATLGKLLNLSATNISSISLKSNTISATDYLNLPNNYTTLSAGTFSATNYLNLPATPTALSSLTDVADVSPSVNQALIWDGAYWTASSIPSQTIQNSYTTLSAGTFSATNYLNLPASATVFGSDSEIQFRGPGSVFSGTSQLTWNSSASSLSSTNIHITSAIQFNTTATPTLAVGQIAWNSTDQTMDIQTTTDTTLQVGQEQVMLVENKSGSTINNGKVVYVSGSTGGSGKLNIALASASSTNSETAFILGVTTQTITDNSMGFVTTFGKVNGIPLPTSAFNDGDIVYLGDTPGELRNYRPIKPGHGFFQLGRVIRAHNTNGILFVTIRGSVDMDEIHDVASSIPGNGQVLVYNTASGLYIPNNVSAISGINNYVLTSVNNTLSTTVTNHIASAVHWDINTLNNNYLNASGDSANASFFLQGLSSTNFSATNYFNLPTFYNTLSSTNFSATNYLNLPTSSLSGLQDVNLSIGQPSNGKVLTWSGTRWIASSVPLKAGTNSQHLSLQYSYNGDLYGDPGLKTIAGGGGLVASSYVSSVMFFGDTGSLSSLQVFGNPLAAKGVIEANNYVSAPALLAGNYVRSNQLSAITISATSYLNLPTNYTTLSAGTFSATNYLNLPATQLSALTDVADVNATTNQALIYNGSFWTPSSIVLPTQRNALSSLTDVSISGFYLGSSPIGKVLTWSSTGVSAGLWVPSWPSLGNQASGLVFQYGGPLSASPELTYDYGNNILKIPNGRVNANEITGYKSSFDIISGFSFVTRDSLNTNTLDFVPATYAIKLTPDSTYGTGEFAVQGKQYISGQLRTVGTHYFSNTSGTSTTSRVTVAQVSSTTVTGINLSSTSLSATSIIATNGLYTGLSSTDFSATNYLNLPVSSLSGLRDVSSPINPSNGQVLTWSSTRWIASSIPLNAGGSNTQVQFNSNGSLAGNSSFTFASATQTLSVGSQINTTILNVNDIFGVASPAANINLIGDTHSIEITPDPVQGTGKVAILGSLIASPGSIQANTFMTAPTLSGTTVSATTYLNIPLSGLKDVSSSLNPTNGQVLTWSSTRWIASSISAGGTPGGSNTQVQFNNAGSFSGSPGMTYDNSTSTLVITNLSATNYYNLNASIAPNYYGVIHAMSKGLISP